MRSRWIGGLLCLLLVAAGVQAEEGTRLEEENREPTDITIGAEPYFPPVGEEEITFPRFLRKFIRANPEFKESPVFTVEDGHLVFRDSFKYKLNPKLLGLEVVPADGSRIRVDIEAVTRAKYNAKGKLLSAPGEGRKRSKQL